jgi:glycerol-3-phosphate dehydrogenase subunit B
MKNYDVAVIGGGFSGLYSALLCAEKGLNTVVIANGIGKILFEDGIIDLLGYYDNNVISDPLGYIDNLPKEHPYSKINKNFIEKALTHFLNFTKQENYEYVTYNKNVWLPTIAGTFKPTFLIPKTFIPDTFKDQKEIIIVNFKRLKDFYPELFVNNLMNINDKYRNKDYKIVNIDMDIYFDRDINIVDLANLLENTEVQEYFAKKMATVIPKNSVVLLPQVFGTNSSYKYYDYLTNTLQAKIIEIIGMPPASSGLRLYNLINNKIKALGVSVINNAKVISSIVNDNKCVQIKTDILGKKIEYQAKYYILATGGFYGGGLESKYPGEVLEPIFNLKIDKPVDYDKWTAELLENSPQPYAKIGVKVNENLQPINEAQQVLVDNVFVAGRNLSGFDPAYEKSNKGVSLASAYKIVSLIGEKINGI